MTHPHSPQKGHDTPAPHSTQDNSGKGPSSPAEVGQTKSGWGLTRNLRGVRRVVDAKRVESSWVRQRGWKDAKGFVPHDALFETRAEAIKVARWNAEAARVNAKKMLENAERDLDKLRRLAAQPE